MYGKGPITHGACSLGCKGARVANPLHVGACPTGQQAGAQAEYLEEQAEKEGRVDPSMPGFTTMFWRRLMAAPTATMNLSEWGVLA